MNEFWGAEYQYWMLITPQTAKRGADADADVGQERERVIMWESQLGRNQMVVETHMHIQPGYGPLFPIKLRRETQKRAVHDDFDLQTRSFKRRLMTGEWDGFKL